MKIFVFSQKMCGTNDWSPGDQKREAHWVGSTEFKNLLTPDISWARLEATSELNRQTPILTISKFTQSCNKCRRFRRSRRAKSRFSGGNSGSSNLPQMKFDKKIFKCPELFNLFTVTVAKNKCQTQRKRASENSTQKHGKITKILKLVL